MPATQYSGPKPDYDLLEDGSWSGNYQLLFPAKHLGEFFSLTAMNDQWRETHFSDSEATLEGTQVIYDESMNPMDFVLTLEGSDCTWDAEAQTGDSCDTNSLITPLNGFAVRALLRGEEMEDGGYLESSGAKCKVQFVACDPIKGFGKKFEINNAYIMQCASSNTPTPDAKLDTITKLTFGGKDKVVIDAGKSVLSDWATFPIDKAQSYLVSYLVIGGAFTNNRGCPWMWDESVAPSNGSCYLWVASDTPQDAETKRAAWSDQLGTKVFLTNKIFGIGAVFVSYVPSGTFESQVFDTRLSAPTYTTLRWNVVKPSGTTVELKARTGNLSDCSDAPEWSAVHELTAPGAINPGMGRYVQFLATLEADSTRFLSPALKDVTISWVGETCITDIGGTFTTGPDYGVFEVKVNDRPLLSALGIDLTISKNVRSYRGNRTVTSSLTTDVRPRNTGK